MFFRKMCFSLLLCIATAGCKSDVEKAQDYYDSALALLESGDVSRAQIELRNALEQQPTFIEARRTLAGINIDRRNFPAAYRNYLRISEQNPDDLEAQLMLAEISFLTKDWRAFSAHSEAAIDLAPEDDPRTRILDIAQRYRQAVIDEETTLRSDLVRSAETLATEAPTNEILVQLLIDGYLNQNRFDDAAEQIEKAISADPDEPSFYVLRVQVLSQLGDDAGVEDGLRDMVTQFPDIEEFQANLLRFLVARNKTDEAETLLREMAENAPDGEYTAYTTLIQFLLEFKSLDAALAELETAISDDPESYTLRTLRASLQYDNGRTDEAIAEMQSIVDSDDDIPVSELLNIKTTLAAMLSRNGNEVGARRLIEDVLTTDASAVRALKMQARWMISDDDTDGAINAMRTALAASPQDSEAMTIMAEAYQRTGNKVLMLDFLSRAMESANNAPPQALRYASALRGENKPLQAESALIAALRTQPNNIDALSALGQIYMELEDFQRAQQVVDTLKRLENDRAATVASNIELQLLARQEGDDKVTAFLEELVRKNGGGGPKLTLVRAHLQKGETDKALVLINELAAENPENEAVLYFRGLAEGTQGDYAKATQTFAELTEKNPSAILAWIQLARLHTTQNEPTLVMNTLEEALSLNPGAADLLWAKASYMEKLNDIDGAIAVYEQLYEANSGSLVIANNLASLLTSYRDDAESLERASLIARRLKGTDTPALQDTYGWILFRLGDTNEALSYLEPAAAGLPNDPTVQYHLGRVYEELGRPTDALERMRRALAALGPLGSPELKAEIDARIAAIGTTAPE